MSSTPAFGQASSFSSPFAGGLGRALSGGTTGAGAPFGAKSSFGAFAQTNQPNAFAQAAGLGGQNTFMQGAQGSGFTATGQQRQQQGGAAFADGGNRFQVLSEVAVGAATGDKDDDMADESSSAVDRAPGFGSLQGSVTTPAIQPVPHPPPEPAVSSTAPLSQPATAPQSRLAVGTQKITSTLAEPPKPAPAQQPAQPIEQTQSTPTHSVRPVIKSAIDEMAAWMADRFTIGQIPETEPPLQVR